MATYLEIWELYQSGNLRTRTAIAAMKAAYDVLNEDAQTENHTNRIAWAAWAMRYPGEAGLEAMWFIVSNASIQASGEASTDGDIQYVMNGAVNTLANRFAT